jgi:hypothetical protein
MKKRSIKKLSLKKSAVSKLAIQGGDTFNTRFLCPSQPGIETCEGPVCISGQQQCHTQQYDDPLCVTHNHRCQTLHLTCPCGSGH